MKRSVIEAAIKASEQKSGVLKETSQELNKESLDLRFESPRLREKSRKLVEEVKKNVRTKKVVRSASDQVLLEKRKAVQTLAGNQTVKAPAEVQ